MAFGRSLHVDLYGIRSELCDDLNFGYQLLEDLVSLLHMQKQSPPFIFHSPSDTFPDKAGLSGWVPLIESGISVHTLTAHEFITIDIYTCGELDVELTLSFLSSKLNCSHFEHHFLTRGIEYEHADM
jgi:S-adenosylmethionine/arginine decarboxylase-like enzyme